MDEFRSASAVIPLQQPNQYRLAHESFVEKRVKNLQAQVVKRKAVLIPCQPQTTKEQSWQSYVAAIYISYIPDKLMVESKSLKLYLFSFRNHGDFHEDCVNIIMKDLIRLMQPRYIEVWGKFTPRGGISIDPYCNYGKEGTAFEDMAKQRLLWHDMNPEKVDNR